MMAQQNSSNPLTDFSAELGAIVERVAPSVVRVDDGTRLTATGVIWSADGVILTTSHGVERDEDLIVELADETRLPATLIGRDPDTDLAVLRVEATDLPAITPAVSGEAKVGHLVLALGRPGTFGLQVTLGIISSRIETQTKGQPEYILHTDATLYPGFSGGPLVDVQGRVIGINNLAFGRGRSFALGISAAANVVQTLLTHGKVQRGYLGVGTQMVPLPEGLRSTLNIEPEIGLLVIRVEPNGPAEQGGIMMGDTLLRLNGQKVPTVDELRQQLRHLQAGQSVTVEVARGGELRTLSVPLGAQE